MPRKSNRGSVTIATNNRLEREYEEYLNKLLKPVKREIAKAKGDVDKITKILERTAESPTYKRKAKEMADYLVKNIYDHSFANWREAAKESTMGQKIYNLLKSEMNTSHFMRQVYNSLLSNNVKLIQTLPLSISERVVKHVESKAMAGLRAEDIAKEIQKFFPLTSKANAKLIARTETAKAHAALTQARSIDLGLFAYVWKTSRDQRVRGSHAHMNDVVILYKYPPVPEKLDPQFKGKKYPQPYHAGNIYNCRCYQKPLTEFDDISWPHKVYNHKTQKIETMTLAKFKEFVGQKEVDHLDLRINELEVERGIRKESQKTQNKGRRNKIGGKVLNYLKRKFMHQEEDFLKEMNKMI